MFNHIPSDLTDAIPGRLTGTVGPNQEVKAMELNVATAAKPVKIPGPDHPITIERNPARVIVSIAGSRGGWSPTRESADPTLPAPIMAILITILH